MTSDETPPTSEDDFAQLLARLKSEYGVSDSEIARRIDVSVSTVNTWVHRKRQPRPDAVRALAREFPAFKEGDLFRALGRQTPGPLTPDRRARLMAYFEELTEEQQELQEIQIRAVVESNHRANS